MILDKAKMAHDYAIEMLKRGDPERSIAFDAWTLADTMQAEADKRKPSGLPESLRKRHDFTKAILEGVGNYEKEEWQPDWSRAPEWANWWYMNGPMPTWSTHDPKSYDLLDFRYSPIGLTLDKAPSFGYTGDWRESLRKRPQ